MNLNELMPQTIKFFVESIEFFTINSKLPILASKVFTEAKKKLPPMELNLITLMEHL